MILINVYRSEAELDEVNLGEIIINLKTHLIGI